MVIYPSFMLTANGNDITDNIKRNLISLTFDDRDGLISDEITFSVADLFDRPLFGEKLTLKLGIDGDLHDYGEFNVHSVSLDYGKKITEVRATSLNFADKIKEKKNKLWEATTLGGIASQIAGNHNLKAVTTGAESVSLKSVTQHNQSDIVFLRDLATDYGYKCLIKDKQIILSKNGSNLPAVSIDIEQCSSLVINKASREKYGSVKMEWLDIDSGKTVSVTAGKGEPVYIKHNTYPKTPAEALRMAEAKLRQLNANSVSGSISCTGGQYINAGSVMDLKGVGGDSGKYLIEGVTHSLNTSAYRMNIKFAAFDY